jgi:hypothetical protein
MRHGIVTLVSPLSANYSIKINLSQHKPMKHSITTILCWTIAITIAISTRYILPGLRLLATYIGQQMTSQAPASTPMPARATAPATAHTPRTPATKASKAVPTTSKAKAQRKRKASVTVLKTSSPVIQQVALA